MSHVFQDILNTLDINGFIMLNENRKHPSICATGGGWDEAIRLINSRRAFLTKLIEDKSTFISPKLYFAIRACQGKIVLSENEKALYEFIQQNEIVDMQVMKICIPIEGKEIKKILKVLQNKLMITAVGESKRISENWGTYLWGTSEHWEKGIKGEYQITKPREFVNHILDGKVSEKKLRFIIEITNIEI